MRRTILIASCLVVLCLSALAVWVYAKRNGQGMPEGNASASGQKIHEGNPYYLRADKRLQVTLNMEGKRPELSQILAKLGEATGLDMAVDRNLRGHDPDYGYIQPSKQGYYAWQIMEMVAKKDLQYGRWEKTDRGYRLVGTSVVPAKSHARRRPGSGAARRSLFWRLIITGVSLVVMLVLIIIRMRGVGDAKTPSKPDLPMGKFSPPQNE